MTLKHEKAKKLLEDLEELDIIKLNEVPFLRKATPSAYMPMSELRDLIKEPMSEEEIDKQLQALRNEWERNF